MQYYFLLAQIHLGNILPFINTFAQSNASCKPKQGFFGFPTWYKYLHGNRVEIDSLVDINNKVTTCSPKLSSINDIWLIVLAGIEILLRIVILLSILYAMYGGLKYITARSNPERIEAAKNTVLDALFGMIIAVAATAVVSFIGGRLTQ